MSLLNPNYVHSLPSTQPFRIGMLLPASINDIDPAKIYYDYEATILEQIYLRPLAASPQNSAPAPLLTNYKWVNDDLVLTLRENKTKSGHKITAIDIEKSIKRVMILGTNTHGDLIQILCPKAKISKITDKCEGLNVVGEDTLILKTRNSQQKELLLRYLQNFDLSVIPSHAIDWSKKEMPIIDYTETSGAYYVSSFKSKSNLTLNFNPKSVAFNNKAPKNIEVLHGFGRENYEKLLNGKIDATTNLDLHPDIIVPEHSEALKNFNKTNTFPLNLYALWATDKSKEFSQEQRLALGKELRKLATANNIVKGDLILADQIFPRSAEAALQKEEKEFLSKTYQKLPEIKNLKCNIGVSTYSKEILERLLKGSKIFNLVSKGDKSAHFNFFTVDTSFYESYAQLSYYFKVKIFDIDNFDTNSWMNTYLNTDTKSDRIELLSKLHLEVLLSAKILPLIHSPFTSILKKPWKASFPKSTLESPFTMITQD